MPTIRALSIAVVSMFVGFAPLAAQTRPEKLIERVSAGTIDAALRDIMAAQAASTDAAVSHEFVIDSAAIEHPRLRYWVASRLRSAGAEIHEQWSDVVFVTEGKAILRTGRKLANGREQSPHEWRSASIENAQEEEVGKGDVFVIPAGIAHQYVIAAGTRFTYLTLKVPR